LQQSHFVLFLGGGSGIRDQLVHGVGFFEVLIVGDFGVRGGFVVVLDYDLVLVGGHGASFLSLVQRLTWRKDRMIDGEGKRKSRGREEVLVYKCGRVGTALCRYFVSFYLDYFILGLLDQ
jgi:hypothetical protein